MLFHEHAVNLRREQRGDPAINSLWFWGGGVSPDSLASDVSRIATDHALGLGLAQLSGTPRVDVPAGIDELLPVAADGVTLVVNDALARRRAVRRCRPLAGGTARTRGALVYTAA